MERNPSRLSARIDNNKGIESLVTNILKGAPKIDLRRWPMWNFHDHFVSLERHNLFVENLYALVECTHSTELDVFFIPRRV